MNFILLSVTFRLHPDFYVGQATGDVRQVVRHLGWTRQNADRRIAGIVSDTFL